MMTKRVGAYVGNRTNADASIDCGIAALNELQHLRMMYRLDTPEAAEKLLEQVTQVRRHFRDAEDFLRQRIGDVL